MLCLSLARSARLYLFVETQYLVTRSAVGLRFLLSYHLRLNLITSNLLSYRRT